MKVGWAIELAGTGKYTPERVVTNEEYAQRLDTSDEWIMQRTGIRERRFAAPEESTLSMATAAARAALTNAGVTPADLDLIVCATVTPEHPLPATGNELQHALGCRTIPSFDVAAACSGFVYSLIMAGQFVHTGVAETVLIVGAECLTRVIDMEERSSCILFGDGSGAAVIRRSREPSRELVAFRMGSDGGGAKQIWIPAGGAREPASVRTVNERLHYMRLRGREVFKFAVTKMRDVVRETLDDAGISVDELALLVPHQSNLRIIESACQRLRIPLDKVVINIDRYGNTSSASIPIALHEATANGRIRPGDLVMLVAFGAGLTWAGALLRY